MGQDGLQLLKEDHEAAEALLARLDEVAPAGRADYLREVRHTLVGRWQKSWLPTPTSRQLEQVNRSLRAASANEQYLADLEHVDPYLHHRRRLLAGCPGTRAPV